MLMLAYAIVGVECLSVDEHRVFASAWAKESQKTIHDQCRHASFGSWVTSSGSELALASPEPAPHIAASTLDKMRTYEELKENGEAVLETGLKHKHFFGSICASLECLNASQYRRSTSTKKRKHDRAMNAKSGQGNSTNGPDH